MITEECSCRAKISLPAGNPSYNSWQATQAALASWRENHRHEMPAAEAESGDQSEVPHIFESAGASVERSWVPSYDEYAQVQVRLGFQRNEVR